MITFAEFSFLSRLEFRNESDKPPHGLCGSRRMSLSMSSSSAASAAAAAASTPKSSSSPAAASSTTSWFSGIVRGRGDKPNTAKLSKSASATGIGSGDYGGPIKGKNQFRGVLFKYGPKSIQVPFSISVSLIAFAFWSYFSKRKETTLFFSRLSATLNWSLVCWSWTRLIHTHWNIAETLMIKQWDFLGDLSQCLKLCAISIPGFASSEIILVDHWWSKLTKMVHFWNFRILLA